jgi:hypothetical protein
LRPGLPVPARAGSGARAPPGDRPRRVLIPHRMVFGARSRSGCRSTARSDRILLAAARERRAVLEQAAGGTGPQHLVDEALLGVDGQGEDPGPRRFPKEPSGNLDAIELRHAHVHDDDIWR